MGVTEDAVKQLASEGKVSSETFQAAIENNIAVLRNNGSGAFGSLRVTAAGSLPSSVVAGDFNTFWGDHEIYLFMEASGLKSANRLGLPSYPSRNPRKELDFVLYSNGIDVTQFDVPDVRFSDHRPLICDFNIRRPPP